MYQNKTIKKTAALTSAALLLACLLACKGKDAACTQPIRSEVYRIYDRRFPVEITFDIDSSLVSDPDISDLLYGCDAIRYRDSLRSLSMQFIGGMSDGRQPDTAKFLEYSRKDAKVLFPEYRIETSKWITTSYGNGAYVSLSHGKILYQQLDLVMQHEKFGIKIIMRDSSDFLCKQEVFMKTIQSVRINK
ncbi:MAG: hypothetical protein J0L99_05980 [Chitinophagales bacterium]|nr:hypothetical protein [Chitinophagales bacterium]